MDIIRLSSEQVNAQYGEFDLYYDRQDKILYSTPGAISRWLGCSIQTIKREGGTLGVGKTAEIPTVKGMQSGTLLTSIEVIEILDSLSHKKRVKQETRDAAAQRLKLLATLGNEFAGMLSVAPDELAKVAINQIKDMGQMADVEHHTARHALYLKEHHGLHDELKNHGAEGIHHATVNKFNNELVGVESGERETMTPYQKDAMTFITLAERMKLEREQRRGGWNAVKVAKDAGEYAQESLLGLLKGE